MFFGKKSRRFASGILYSFVDQEGIQHTPNSVAKLTPSEQQHLLHNTLFHSPEGTANQRLKSLVAWGCDINAQQTKKDHDHFPCSVLFSSFFEGEQGVKALPFLIRLGSDPNLTWGHAPMLSIFMANEPNLPWLKAILKTNLNLNPPPSDTRPLGSPLGEATAMLYTELLTHKHDPALGTFQTIHQLLQHGAQLSTLEGFSQVYGMNFFHLVLQLAPEEKMTRFIMETIVREKTDWLKQPTQHGWQAADLALIPHLLFQDPLKPRRPIESPQWALFAFLKEQGLQPSQQGIAALKQLLNSKALPEHSQALQDTLQALEDDLGPEPVTKGASKLR